MSKQPCGDCYGCHSDDRVCYRPDDHARQAREEVERLKGLLREAREEIAKLKAENAELRKTKCDWDRY